MCIVTSLHDGMNLVSKEFVAARDDERGVLILSRFAGAAREMTEALIVNPYHVGETADALPRGDDAGRRAARAHAACARWCASSTCSAGPGACSPTPPDRGGASASTTAWQRATSHPRCFRW